MASPTPTPTATPAVISLPVRNGTPVPDLPYEVITAENVHRLREVARYGYPRLLEGHPYRLTADGRTIVVGTTAGIEFYEAGTQRKTGGFEVDFLRSFDVTPDGRFVLTLAGESLVVWTAEGEKVQEYRAKLQSEVEKLDSRLVLVVVLFFFVPFMALLLFAALNPVLTIFLEG